MRRGRAVLALLWLLARALPINPLSDRLLRLALERLDLIPAPSTVRLSAGRRMHVFAERPRTLINNLDYYVYFFGTWEPRLTRAVARLVKRGDTCFDLGANAGWYTLLFSSLVGPTGQVHAFEPDERPYAQLQRNVAASESGGNVRINRLAVGRASGTAGLYIRPASTLYSSVFPRAATDTPSQTVTVASLDEYVATHRIDRVDFVKCDVEGSELDVLHGGAERVFGASRKPIVQIEANPGSAAYAGTSVGPIFEFLLTRAYRFNDVSLTGRLRPIDPARITRSVDVIATPTPPPE